MSNDKIEHVEEELIIINEEKKEEIKEKDNVFFTCKKISVDNATNKCNLIILKSTPEKPQPNTYYLTLKNAYTWNVTYYTPLLQKIRYNIDHYTKNEVDLESLRDELEKILDNLNLEKKDQKLYDEVEKKIHTILKNNKSLNQGYYVGIGGSNCGKKLYSTHFAPCHVVIAILKNGGYGLYHALTPSSGGYLDKFINIIRDDVVAVFIFHKESNTKNLTAAPWLAINIAIELFPITVPVNTVLLEHYTCVAIDSNKIVLGENFEDKTITSGWLETSELDTHSLEDSSPIEESIQLILKANNYKYKIVKDKTNNDAIEVDSLIIPSSLITDTVQYVLKKQPTDIKNASSQYSPALYKNTEFTLKNSLKIIKNNDTPKNASPCNIL